MLKLGSLFDGSGTAPLAAAMCGIEPVWASEIEPYPIKVTKKRFPGMKHLGSILDINGADVEPVDIICGGSPCQDLSVAGKQKGLIEGERSHLFFEMTRIIKEMRDATNGKYPHHVIWENVCGALSSNKGRDFLAVLQAFAQIADPNVYVPRPACKGKTDRLAWQYAGTIMGDGYSIAWRTVDAQYWGVPQRRRRLYLVADLRGERAGEILFEREGDTWFFNQATEVKLESSSCCSGFITKGIDEDVSTVFSTDTGFWNTQEQVSGTMCARDFKCIKLLTIVRKNGDVVNRKCTPLEYCRLQGFPDYWTEGIERYPASDVPMYVDPTGAVEGSDSAKYKMWGNGMALPNMLHVMQGIVRCNDA